MDLVKIKVCGLRDNIAEVVALQPDYVGFIFYPKSPRYIGEDFEMPMIDPAIKKVGVFVNESEENIVDAVQKYGLDYVQLHGNESVEICQGLKAKGVGVIKAFAMDGQFDFSVLERYSGVTDYFLFDTKTTNYGGSGKSFDWKLLANYSLENKYFLSGGIGLENLNEIRNIDLGKVHAIDVNSRFEVSPGLKDISGLSELRNEIAGTNAER